VAVAVVSDLSEDLWLKVTAREDPLLEARSLATPDLESPLCGLDGDSARVYVGVCDWAAAEATWPERYRHFVPVFHPRVCPTITRSAAARKRRPLQHAVGRLSASTG
jgi:hypothetical protein